MTFDTYLRDCGYPAGFETFPTECCAGEMKFEPKGYLLLGPSALQSPASQLIEAGLRLDKMRSLQSPTAAVAQPGPTGWPVSYLEPADAVRKRAAWSAGAQQQFSDFFPTSFL